jgi:hypothetical protein
MAVDRRADAQHIELGRLEAPVPVCRSISLLYGTPSSYEDPAAGFGSHDGIITPNGLFYERHHGGIPNIDPAQHRLIVHGLVQKPLIFTMDVCTENSDSDVLVM